MLYDVYHLFNEVQKLSIDQVKANAPVMGQLIIGTIRRNRGRPPMRTAALSGGEHKGGLLLSLDDCIEAKFNKASETLLFGTEVLIRKPNYKGQNDTYLQQ